MVADAGRNSEAANALGSTFTKSGKGEMAACSFSAEAERHSLKRSSPVTTAMTFPLYLPCLSPDADIKIVRTDFFVPLCRRNDSTRCTMLESSALFNSYGSAEYLISQMSMTPSARSINMSICAPLQSCSNVFADHEYTSASIPEMPRLALICGTCQKQTRSNARPLHPLTRGEP